MLETIHRIDRPMVVTKIARQSHKRQVSQVAPKLDDEIEIKDKFSQVSLKLDDEIKIEDKSIQVTPKLDNEITRHQDF